MPGFLKVGDWINWLNLPYDYVQDEQKIKVIKFVFLWMEYNNWYSQKYNLPDSKGSVKLSDTPQAGMVYDGLRLKFLSLFQKIPRMNNVSGMRMGIYKENGRDLEAPYSNGADCLCKFLYVIYKIRCNFFHGFKTPTSTNVLLICWAYDCLSELMDELKLQHII